MVEMKDYLFKLLDEMPDAPILLQYNSDRLINNEPRFGKIDV